MPPRGTSADKPAQTPGQIASAIADFLAAHPSAALLEDGNLLFDLRAARHELSTAHGRCTLHLWSTDGETRNLVRRVLSTESRNHTLRLQTQRFGHAQPKLLELVADRQQRTPTALDTARTRYLRTLERVLFSHFPDWKADAFRTAMDLEKSFGPAYARGSLIKGGKGNHAFAVIGVNEHETQTTIDAILTLGILWLHHCREHASGRRLYQGLKLIVPTGTSQLTRTRLAWLNADAAQWHLYELNPTTEELTELDPADTGNLRSRLIHRPDETSARERFGHAIEQVHELISPADHSRIDQHLRSTTELIFLLHGLEFARARVVLSSHNFEHAVELTIGIGPNETPVTPVNRAALEALLADLFARRRAFTPTPDFGRSRQRIGAATLTHAAHKRLDLAAPPPALHQNPTQDLLYRAAPERWLESVLRANLAPLTRSLAPAPAQPWALDPEPSFNSDSQPIHSLSTTIPHLDPHHVYSQVPAIAGVSDRGLLDLLGVTADGRLAVIELKADDDLHLALQGLDYWIRVRNHHLQPEAAGQSDFHRHGYFRTVELSPLPPRLYLIAPALHIHPATEIVLRYLSPKVEWHLLALDERWRTQIRVVWRKHS